MRSLRASLKKLVGLNLTDPVCKLWVKAFTGTPLKQFVLIPKGSPLDMHLKEFNIDGLSESAIYAEASSIEANPTEFLPKLFHFDDPMSPHYFQFCKLLLSEDNKSKRLIMKDVMPHMMRLVIVFDYQLKRDWNRIVSARESEKFPLEFVCDYASVLRAILLLRASELGDFFLVFRSTLAFLENKLSMMIEKPLTCYGLRLIREVITLATDFFVETESIDKVYGPLVSFFSLFMTLSIMNEKMDEDMLLCVEKGVSAFGVKLKPNDLVDWEVGQPVITMIAQIFFFLARHQEDERKQHVPFAIILLQMLTQVAPLDFTQVLPPPFVTIDADTLAKSIISFLRTIFKVYFPGEVTVIEPPHEIKLSEERYENEHFEFIEEQLIDNNATKEFSKRTSQTAAVVPSIFNGSPSVLTLFVKVSSFAEKDKNFTKSLTRVALDGLENRVISQYFTVSMLLLGDATFVATAIRDNEVWPRLLTAPAFAPVSELTPKTELNDMTETLIWVCYTSQLKDQVALIETLSWLLISPFSSNVMRIVVKLLNSSIQKFVESMKSTTFVDKLIQLDEIILRCLQKDKTRSNLKSLRSYVFICMMKLASSPAGCAQLLETKPRRNHVFSLLFELGVQDYIISIIDQGLRNEKSLDLVVQDVNYVLCGSMNRIDDEKWQTMTSKLLTVLDKNCSDAVGKALLRASIILTLNKIAATTSNFELTLHILVFLSNFCAASLEFTNELSNTQWQFCETWTGIIKARHVDKTVVNILKRMTFLDDSYSLIRNPEALKVLLSVVSGTPFQKEIVAMITDVAKDSPMNLFLCSCAGTVGLMLDMLHASEDDSVFELLKLVASAFFTRNDLGILLTALENVGSKYTLKLSHVFAEIVNAAPVTATQSFFYVDESNCLEFDEFTFPSKFTVSMLVRLEKKTTDGEFIKIYNQTQAVIVKLVDRCLHIISGHGQLTKIGSPFELNRWYTLKIDFYGKKVDVFRDNVILATCNQNKSFTFQPKTVSMRIGNVKCLVDRINLFVQGGMEACYTAQVIKNHICPNIFPMKSSFGGLTFTGFFVKSITRMLNMISICGGPRILLPVFAALEKSYDPQRFLMNLLQPVLCMAKSTQLLTNQSFFRCLSQTLFRSKAVDRDVISLLYDIYNEIHDPGTKGEILVHIFCKWELFEPDLRHFVIATILPQVVAKDGPLFISLFSVKWLILSFHAYAGESESLVSDFWALVEHVSTLSFTEDDAECIICCVSDLSHIGWFEGALNMVYSMVAKNDILKKSLREKNVYDPFFPILSTLEEDIQMKGLMMMNYIETLFPDVSFSKRIMHGLNVYQVAQITPRTFDLLLSFLFGFINSAKGLEGQEVFQDLTVANAICNANYLPLICFVLHMMKDSKERAEVLRQSILLSEPSLRAVCGCHDWPFWLLFLCNFGGNWLEWVDAVAHVTVMSMYQPNSYTIMEIETHIRVCAAIFGQSFEQAMHQFMKTITQKERITKINLPDVIRYIYFVPELTDSIEVSEEKKCDIHLLASTVISLKSPCITKYHFEGCSDESDEFKMELATDLVRFLIDKLSDISLRTVQIASDPMSVHIFIVLCIHALAVGKRPESCYFLDEFASDPAFRTARRVLPYILADFESDPERYGKLSSAIGDSSDREDINKILDEQATAYSMSFNERSMATLGDLRNTLSAMFTPIQIFGADFQISAEECQNSMNRLIRQDKFFWESVESNLRKFSGIWSQTETSYHWKLDKRLDAVGRRMKMKIDDHFNDHQDAALHPGAPEPAAPVSIERSIISFALEDQITNREVVMQITCQLVTVTCYYKGKIYFTPNSIIFESNETADPLGDAKEKAQKLVEVQLNSIVMVLRRKYLHKDIAAEVFTNTHKSYFFVFTARERGEFISRLKHANADILQLKASRKVFNDLGLQKYWMAGKISNYEYIFWLNMFSGRSFNDIAQYPVFPWVLSNYDSKEIDLGDEANYRDLSKPIGALNPERLATLENLYQEIKDTPTGCLYRFHYSAPAYVIHYLLRCEPFTSLHIALQSGKFDHSSRLFKSIPASWKSCVGTSPDFRELIPEFYSMPDFLVNSEHYPLGDGVDDVELPAWSSNPTEFICINRNALESDIASRSLHLWIDLIFGCKQQSYEARNLFHPYTESRSLQTSDEPAVVEHYAANFGIIPEKLFTEPHPQRTFHPASFNFSSMMVLEFQVIGKVNKVLKIWNEDSSIFLLEFPGKITKMSLENFQLKSYCKCKLEFPEALSNSTVFAKRSAVIPGGSFVVSNPWYEGFQVFNIKETGTGGLLYKREREARMLNCLTGDLGFIVTGGEDSSLTVWDLVHGLIVTSISAHSHPIIAVAFSACLDLIVSVDSTGLVAYSSTLGQSARKMKKQQVTNACIAQCGIVVISSELRNLDDVTTIFEAYNLSQTLICTCRIPGRVEASCICTLGDRSEYLCVCMSTRKVYLLRCYDMHRMCCGEVTSNVLCCTFSTEANMIVLCLEGGEIVTHRFAM